MRLSSKIRVWGKTTFLQHETCSLFFQLNKMKQPAQIWSNYVEKTVSLQSGIILGMVRCSYREDIGGKWDHLEEGQVRNPHFTACLEPLWGEMAERRTFLPSLCYLFKTMHTGEFACINNDSMSLRSLSPGHFHLVFPQDFKLNMPTISHLYFPLSFTWYSKISTICYCCYNDTPKFQWLNQ